jgi:hypothetical protein
MQKNYHLLNNWPSIKFWSDKMASCTNQLHPSIEGLKQVAEFQIEKEYENKIRFSKLTI